MQNQGNRQGTINFAELETGGKRLACPGCHVPFTPHLGNLIAARFQCETCKANLTFRSTTGRTVRCPCCSLSRPMPSLRALACDGCNATVIYQKDDRAVKCFLCKHITISPEADPSQVNRVPPHVLDRDFLPIFKRVVPPVVNRVPPPVVNRVVPPVVNRIVPPVVNLTAPVEIESTASSFAPKPESSHTTVADSVFDSVAQIVRNVALGIGTNKREVEEDKTEAKSKKIRRL